MPGLLRDNVYQAIRQSILSCELQPGQELREQVLAAKYRVSRSPVRDSLLRLEHEKLVTVLPRQGYRVNPITIRDVEELFDLRLIIAPACAAKAALVDDDAAAALDVFRTIDGDPTHALVLIDHNRAFHRAVAELGDNARLAAVEFALIEESMRLVMVNVEIYRSDWAAKMMDEHLGIIEAIQAHDSGTAYRLVRDHVAGGQTRLLAALRAEAAQRNQSVIVEGGDVA